MYTLVKVYKEPDIGLYNKNTNELSTFTHFYTIANSSHYCKT